MPEIDLYNDQGELLDQESLESGSVVYDEQGNAYEFTLEDLAEDTEKELETVGKSDENPFLKKNEAKRDTTYAAQVLEELSKAYTDEARDEVLSKAFGKVEELQKALEANAELAKSERDLRLTREYISKADEYNVPVDAKELGPVLYRMAEQMSFEDCSVIAKCLEASSDLIFTEIGNIGGGDNDDIMSRVDALVDGAVSKAEAGVSKADTVQALFDEAPEAYEQYRAERS